MAKAQDAEANPREVQRCERCNREVGPELITCPERASGSCVYTLQQDRPNLRESCKGWLLVVCGLLVLALVSLPAFPAVTRWRTVTAGMGTEETLVIGTLLGVGYILALVIVIGGVYHALGKRETLFNPTTGTTWQRTSLLGVEIRQVTMTAMQPLAITLELPPELQYRPVPRYPASITALPLDAVARWPYQWNKEGGVLFAAALTVLLARGLLAVGRTSVSISTLGRQPRAHVRGGSETRAFWRKPSKKQSADEYLIVPGPNGTAATVDGALEQKIMRAVTEWAQQSAARELPVAPTLFDLVHVVVPAAYHPGDRLVRMVQKDASARQLGSIRGGFFETKRKFIPDPVHVGRLRDDGQVVRALQESLWRSQPDFARYMYDRIERGISSRTMDPGPMSD